MLWMALWLGCARPPGAAPLPALPEPPPGPRNVILVIGDGMGPQQLGLLEALHRTHDRGPTHVQRLASEGVMALSLHHPADGLVTDSACSATQLATASPSRNGMVGVDADGREQPNLRELAHTLGKATGIVSDTRLTHATPGAFLAHVPYRGAEDTIAEQIVASTVDVALSGGRRHFHAGEGGRDDERDLLDEARSAGFDVVATADELTAAGPRVLGLFSDGGMPNAMVTADQPEVPTLAAMASAALTRLEDDPDGFLLVVEAGQIDWAAHANDAGWMLAELKRFDEALGVLLSYAEAHNDTLLVVTADHETGGFGIGASDRMPITPVDLPGLTEPWDPKESAVDRSVLTSLEAQEGSVFQLFDALYERDEADRTPEVLAALVQERWGWELSVEAADRILSEHPMPRREGLYGHGGYAAAGALAEALADQTGMIWSTAGHTHTPVPVMAFGPGADAFRGWLHHTDVGARLQQLL